MTFIPPNTVFNEASDTSVAMEPTAAQKKKCAFITTQLNSIMLLLFHHHTQNRQIRNQNISAISFYDGGNGITMNLAPCPYNPKDESFVTDGHDRDAEKDIESFFSKLRQIKKVVQPDSSIIQAVIGPHEEFPVRSLSAPDFTSIFDLFETYMKRYRLKCVDNMTHNLPIYKEDFFNLVQDHIERERQKNPRTPTIISKNALLYQPMRSYLSRETALYFGIYSTQQDPYQFSINMLRVLHATSQDERIKPNLIPYHLH